MKHALIEKIERIIWTVALSDICLKRNVSSTGNVSTKGKCRLPLWNNVLKFSSKILTMRSILLSYPIQFSWKAIVPTQYLHNSERKQWNSWKPKKCNKTLHSLRWKPPFPRNHLQDCSKFRGPLYSIFADVINEWPLICKWQCAVNCNHIEIWFLIHSTNFFNHNFLFC